MTGDSWNRTEQTKGVTVSKARIMDFVGFLALTVLAVVLFTRPAEHIWFKVGGGAAIAYALYCLFRGFTRAEE
jgi:hypothetical protein